LLTNVFGLIIEPVFQISYQYGMPFLVFESAEKAQSEPVCDD